MNNAASYSAQVFLLVVIAAGLPWILRLELPKARLWFWQGVLAVCLLLPLVQPRRSASVDFTIQDGPMRAGTPIAIQPSRRLPAGEVLAGIYITGVALRGLWLLAGCCRLRRYRQSAIDSGGLSDTVTAARERLGTFPDIRISSEIASPVTFGLFRPIVLLPNHFPDLDVATQEAVVVHELIHVRRGDWMFSIAEEIVRCIFWYHPAIWWLLSQIQLTREQVVDRASVEFTRSREQYLQALLAVAKTKIRPDLALAPLFLRKRYLTRRIAAVMKEIHMSKSRLVTSLAIAFAGAFIVAGTAVVVFPLQSAAQEVRAQGAGVSVDTQGRQLLHGSRVEYPRKAVEQGIQGTVTAQLNLNTQGEVVDVRIESGPEELRTAVLSAVLQWHFSNPPGQPITIPVSVNFRLAQASAGGALKPPRPALLPPSVLRRIDYSNLPENMREALQRRLSVREGDTLNNGASERLAAEIRSVDEHLNFGYRVDSQDGSGTLYISLGDTPPLPNVAPPFNPPPTEGVRRIRVGGNVQSSKLIEQPKPVYPPLAKQARVQGTVRYNVLIASDGTIRQMDLVAGHPLLVEAATPAVRQWRYQPTLLNGEAVEVVTMVDVNFTLSQ
jgi:TonB family protein